ncbi:ribosome small subunit-dependent GTPase A [Acidiferrimicrobium sp. IK]|uniref:ribosome small subunit-dependent GTPase A n=1 Tax=Acidiferrimicrobium sp. IK TaxID=2871700 RepID=UPI0021CB19BB|nr:ribosome small subunit-dependent GTPase A [Acidiferrimicrobium sp. IK]MCU4182826.1 ribosome small subunit-dependent GTPase A [Acidiferrimicrobium sp. IK]
MADAADVEAFLRHLGGDDDTVAGLLANAVAGGPLPGRVVRAERIAAEVATPEGVFLAGWDEPVCTGDWVLARPDPGADGPPRSGIAGRITWLAPRHSAFVRRSADSDQPQVLAANIDEIWIVVAADEPLSPARLERTLVLAWDSGAQPVAVLTKTDRVEHAALDAVAAVLEQVGPGIPAVAVSSVTGDGLALLSERLGPGRSAALLGRSGAGKSTLVNALAGTAVAVGEVRARDGKGRHTTNWRELVVVPGGGALIDTPGLRGVGLWIDEGGLAAAFSDITELAASCRFSDCAHTTEPGCAVRAAIQAGALDPARLARYRALSQEAAETEDRNQARVDARAQRAAAGRRARIRANDRRRTGD